MFSFIEGDVPIPPYPSWAVTDATLRSVAKLLRRYHEAVRSFISGDAEWPRDLADPAGGGLLCHNDVCLENVVFRKGQAVGLLDFDFAARGRRAFDVGMTLWMCGPVGHPTNAPESFGRLDPVDRLAVFCEAYGVDADQGAELVDGLLSACDAGRRFVQSRARAGDPWFKKLWEAHGPKRFEKDKEWVDQHADEIIGVVA